MGQSTFSHVSRCLLVSTLAAAAFAQEARLSGNVLDATGGAVGNAKIAVTQAERNISFATLTSEDGRFILPRLPIGSYRVVCEAPGFKQFVSSGVDLTTNADVLLNITMELGSVTEQVTVMA